MMMPFVRAGAKRRWPTSPSRIVMLRVRGVPLHSSSVRLQASSSQNRLNVYTGSPSCYRSGNHGIDIGHHARKRLVTTSASPQASKGRRRPWALILSFCLGGAVSVFALRSQDNLLSSESLPINTPSISSHSPAYGNPTDFQSAIHELQEAFPEEDRVTTDPDDLHDHGFSVNDYHPGKNKNQAALYK